jgi:predicted extracellular nuclease
VVLDAGSSTSLTVAAADPDDIADWVGLEVAPVPSSGSFTLVDATPAPAPGETATAEIVVDSATAVETYEVTVTASNEAGETASCDVRVDVVGLVAIHDVQGSGDVSPLDGSTVIVEGVVVGDFQQYTGGGFDSALGGFMLQEEDADADTDPSTSEGLFIYAPGAEDVNVGDLVSVKGTVSEYFGLTEIAFPDEITVLGTDMPLPTPATPLVPTTLADTPVDWESIEGMSVQFAQPLYVTGLFPHGAFGEVQLSAIGAQDHPNQVAVQGSEAAADIRALNLASRVILDDGEDENENQSPPRTTWNPSVTPYLGADRTLRSGDVVENLAGVVHYSYGEYEVHPVNVTDPTDPTGAVEFDRVKPRTAVPDVGGTLKVASFNVLNYFTTFGSRGADNADEFARQSEKIVAALIEIDADIVGLMEIENNGTAIADLVGKLNAASGATRTYGYVDTGVVGGDAIAVALIYDVDTVSTVEGVGILDSTVSPAFLDNRNRPVIAQTFREASTDEMVTVAVTHLKSKGSACDDQANPGDPAFGVDPYAGDPELADFAGNCNLTRAAAAKVLGQWLDSDPTNSGAQHALIVGDLNAYANEDPITTLEGLGYTDLNELYSGGTSWAEGGHTYVFDGELGSLDYAMANGSALGRVTGAAAWHINADEPFALDYNDYNPVSNYAADQWKASDHDPVIVGLDLARPLDDATGVRDALAALLPASDGATTRRLTQAIDRLDASLDPDLWVDDQTITSKRVFDYQRQAITQLELVVASGSPEAEAAQSAIDTLINADRQLARIAIIVATEAGGNPARLAEAELAMAEAAAYTAAGLYNEAVNAYKVAWDQANKA